MMQPQEPRYPSMGGSNTNNTNSNPNNDTSGAVELKEEEEVRYPDLYVRVEHAQLDNNGNYNANNEANNPDAYFRVEPLKDGFSTGLISCPDSDSQVTLLWSTLLPCVQMADLETMRGEVNPTALTRPKTILGTTCGLSAFLPCVFSAPFLICLMTRQRQLHRQALGIRGSLMADCAESTLCLPCSLMQTTREYVLYHQAKQQAEQQGDERTVHDEPDEFKYPHDQQQYVGEAPSGPPVQLMTTLGLNGMVDDMQRGKRPAQRGYNWSNVQSPNKVVPAQYGYVEEGGNNNQNQIQSQHHPVYGSPPVDL
eukprot:TRINITY_DN46891_c0_g1_i1.p1 TRINITY_DN46891_c0_g1~~TRINITY_DN46891_c0_g1_i1.p1  ORF type:complete len:310 (+),score=144.10 TRINITY_DN46891_c0_g1_i1:102-1031(+)